MSAWQGVKGVGRAIGPAIIVASIVLGPGSVLTSSKVGCQFGYSMLWVLATAVLLMMGMTALGAFLGATTTRTPCQYLADTLGRPAAVVIGVLVFLIVACFQAGNNAAVIASIDGLAPARASDAQPADASEDNAETSESTEESAPASHTTKLISLLVLNAIAIVTVLGVRRLYRPLELLMMGLVLMMLIGFGANLLLVRPSVVEVFQGLVPSLPEGGDSAPQALWPLLGLVATTFSVAAAFYQCYLVRDKGWSVAEARKGLGDSIVGIALLGIISATIMITSAAALHGNVAPEQLNSTAEIARQLEPLFGPFASILFSCGIFAAAFSGFLGNALLGGTVLSDGLGWGSSVNDVWAKRLTVLALVVGMAIACYSTLAGKNSVNFIVFAQALTVIGLPPLAALMVWLGLSGSKQQRPVPIVLLVVGAIGLCVTLVLAARTLINLL
ncbi:divalent metal cation transporter [Aeoliella sp. ICT_H6.2]|uniref:Divalent metal cation transporter n=1 Tax=Aeoliella straminimaris TaxID=2954799 RepID=A0A9X2FDQ0_9BACT|nr:divalent metal cation transporter [Aeoliella straminimaris]MCO6044434.1 divalent metal cation transporter [Aeoliella straminimaris]